MPLTEEVNRYGNTYRRVRPGVWVLAGFVAVLLLISAVTVWIGGTWSSTNTSYGACVFNGGWVDNKNYRDFARPGSGREYQGWMSQVTYFPTGTRQYRVSLDPAQGDTPAADSIRVRVKGYDMQFEPTVTFTLSSEMIEGKNGTRKPAACELIERHLRQFNATDFDKQGGNWQYKFLNERFRPILNDVANRVLQTYDPAALKFNTDGARDAASLDIGTQLNDRMIQALGGDFFCSPSYTFQAGADACGDVLTVTLPAPVLSAEDEAQLAKPERAKIDANNDIAVATEAGRKASQVATQKGIEADAAKDLADANEEIAAQNVRVQAAQATLDYAWCAYLVSLSQRCDLVLAAQNKNYPQVIGADPAIAVPIPTPAAPASTVPGG